MKHLLEWIRAAERVRATCQNASEFDALIRFQKQRLKELERRSGQNMADQTSDEFKRQCVDKMGEQLGIQYSALWQEVAVIHLNWKEYVELFGTNPQRVEMLNQAAPMFFHMIQNEGWEACLLALARITDSPKSAGRENLTIRNLPTLTGDPQTKTNLNELIELALKATEFCRDWRNRHVAHRDLSLALKEPTKELAEGNRAKVNAALKAIADVLNAVQGHYMDQFTPFDFASAHNGAVTLLYLIHRGLKANKQREARILKGEHLEDDLDPNL
jgi:hypothetical protein